MTFALKGGNENVAVFKNIIPTIIKGKHYYL